MPSRSSFHTQRPPRAIVTAGTAVLAGHEPDLFNAYASESWPSTFLPAFELVAAARRCHRTAVAEDADYTLRLAFFRDDVAADFRHSRRLPIQGSPQIFWPDGSTAHNPGMTDRYWRGGLMRINSADPGEPERLLRTFVEQW
jgi:hypothetical protein